MVWNYHLWKSKGEQFYSAVENMTLGKKAKTNAGHYSLIKKIIVKVLYINTDARFWGCWIKKTTTTVNYGLFLTVTFLNSYSSRSPFYAISKICFLALSGETTSKAYLLPISMLSIWPTRNAWAMLLCGPVLLLWINSLRNIFLVIMKNDHCEEEMMKNAFWL